MPYNKATFITITSKRGLDSLRRADAINFHLNIITQLIIQASDIKPSTGCGNRPVPIKKEKKLC